VFAVGSSTSGADEWLSLFDPGPTPARVTITASGLGVETPLAPQALPAGGRVTIDIGRALAKGIVVLTVRSSVPVVAERTQFVVGAAGLSTTVGIVEEP
jgi:hypothetical protein